MTPDRMETPTHIYRYEHICLHLSNLGFVRTAGATKVMSIQRF